MKTPLIFIFALISFTLSAQNTIKRAPVAIGIAGLTHDHVNWIFNSAKENNDFKIVGIAEPNRDLAERYSKRYNFSMDLVYPTLAEMLEKRKPEAVTAFNSIYEHLAVVKACAPKGIHVMVEKPLAVSVLHAREMETLAKKHNINLLTNYETTWYGSHYETYKEVHSNNTIGGLRKIVVHDGHRGPKEIGVSKEFFDWLTDPVQNGGGALMDFGCYGANLITWLMKGEKPKSVTAITHQFKPGIYPKVDDEATIIVAYEKTQGIIQASWNWPYGRKDIEVYGETGYYKADRTSLVFRKGDDAEISKAFPSLTPPSDNPFSYLAAVVRGDIKVQDTDLSSLPLNVTAVEILVAAGNSAREGKTIVIKTK
jgi:predicted dehydrogenase